MKLIEVHGMKPVEIKKNIYWVGGIDWSLRNFHGYLTQRGSTYNAYLVIDDKVTLIDTVKHYLCDEMIERISAVIDPSKIDYIIANHVEMDHSGSLPRMRKVAPGAEVITSPNGQKGLQEHFDPKAEYRVVQSGETLNTGKHTFSFVHTPMVHWPDNMVTYLADQEILFSNDAFGQHLATSERFDDEYPLDIILHEARKYYANIVLPYGAQVKKALEAASGLKISTVAPSHGLIWRRHISDILDSYGEWCSNKTVNKAVIVYDTMWHSTKEIAFSIQRVFENRGCATRMMGLQENHISDVMTEIIDARFVCVGSPTLNNNMLPTVAAFLTYMKGLVPKQRIGLAFGSYGWGGQSIGQVDETLKSCGFEMIESIRCKYVPRREILGEIEKKLETSLKSL
jgi:flavorubredoxin